MQVMVNSLNDMPASENRIDGSHGIGILLGNSMMFQRFPTHKEYEDPQLSNFYGMVLPLLKRGVPVETVHMENLGFADTLKDIKVLVMSYANMKPLSPDCHKHLAAWIRQGGVLIYVGRDNDPFQEVREWWNTEGNQYKAPSEHLFEQMNLQPTEDKQRYTYGSGVIYVVRRDPKELVLQPEQDEAYLALARQAYEQDAKAGTLRLKDYLRLQRGPYDIIAVMDESVDAEPLRIDGPVIDLFDPELPVLTEKVVVPGQQAYLYNLGRVAAKGHPKVLCAACRVYNEQIADHSYSFVAKSPSGTQNVMRILLPDAPVKIEVTGPDGQDVKEMDHSWDAGTHTCRLRFPNHCDGVRVTLNW